MDSTSTAHRKQAYVRMDVNEDEDFKFFMSVKLDFSLTNVPTNALLCCTLASCMALTLLCGHRHG